VPGVANVSSIVVAGDALGATWQPELISARSSFEFDRAFTSLARHELAQGAWLDHECSWARGTDDLCARAIASIPWQSNTVTMYDRIVAEPRLTCFALHDHLDEFPEVEAMSIALSARYERDLCRIGAALYRDGNDSVAWHGDRFPTDMVEPMVAIVSLGARRQLRVRPRGGGTSSIGVTLAAGDLVVLGGTVHRTHEHCVPKTRRAVGARLSVMFREPSSIAG